MSVYPFLEEWLVHAASDDELRCFVAWLACDVATEEFDRLLPGYFHPRDDEAWIPVDVARSLSLLNADREQYKTERALAAAGMSRATVARIRALAGRMKYSAQVRALRYLCPPPPPEIVLPPATLAGI